MLNKLEKEIMRTLKGTTGFHTDVFGDNNSIHGFYSSVDSLKTANETVSRLIAKARAMYAHEPLRISRDTWDGEGHVEWMHFCRDDWRGKWSSRWEREHGQSECCYACVAASFHFKGHIEEEFLTVHLNVRN